jgi:protein SCO1/2
MRISAQRLRLVSRLLVGALVVVVGLIVALHDRLARGQPAPQAHAPVLHGILLGTDAAPAFTLADQSGASVSLAALAGHPVVLTFLYTHCPTVCPLTAEKLHAAVVALGGQAAQVDWLAVSMDPAGDTPQAARDFVAAHHLTGTLRYLLGTQAQLAPLWAAYHIAVLSSGDAMAQSGPITHNVGVYLLDKHGAEREFYDDAFTADDVASDLRLLLAG